jgi:hypothetical protein
MGAKRTITIDLNPYLKRDLIGESLRHISEHKEHIKSLFGTLLVSKRLDDLVAFSEICQFLDKRFSRLVPD